jgi:enoyl-CoA hydratase/carnithine racemase
MSRAQMVDTGTQELLCQIEDRVATITFNRPGSRNSLSDELTPALREMILRLGEDDTVGAVLLTGTGDAFCSGGNVKGMGGNRSVLLTREEATDQLKERQRTLTGRIMGLKKPTIAALPGPAVGAGLSIALACDIRFASENAFLATGYVRIALSGDYGMSWLLTQLVGTAKARELIFTGRRVEANEAERIGLLNRITSREALATTAFEFARDLANGPAATLSLMKDNLDFALTHDFLESLDREAENMVRSASTDNHKEAVAAFIEKRSPKFSN